jgi:hypothetical protein
MQFPEYASSVSDRATYLRHAAKELYHDCLRVRREQAIPRDAFHRSHAREVMRNLLLPAVYTAEMGLDGLSEVEFQKLAKDARSGLDVAERFVHTLHDFPQYGHQELSSEKPYFAELATHTNNTRYALESEEFLSRRVA